MKALIKTWCTGLSDFCTSFIQATAVLRRNVKRKKTSYKSNNRTGNARNRLRCFWWQCKVYKSSKFVEKTGFKLIYCKLLSFKTIFMLQGKPGRFRKTESIDPPLLLSCICEIDPKEKIDPSASSFFASLSVLRWSFLVLHLVHCDRKEMI